MNDRATTNPLQSFDALDWAREFMRLLIDGTFARNGGLDESLMLTWFANALMRGYDEHRWQQEAQPATPEPSADQIFRINHAAIREGIEAEQRAESAEAQLAAAQQEWTVQWAEAERWRDQLAAVHLPPREQSPEVRAQLLPCLETLSGKLCQTQAFILWALEQSGLTVALLTPGGGTGEGKV